MFAIERLMMFYLPRICNHCLNPACVAACPSGAFYKRGEDGVVLVDQNRCRAWRACVAACPYKKTYYNWTAGKSEKCILCFPRVETGQAPACFIRAWGASGTSACCCMTPRGSPRWRRRLTGRCWTRTDR
jgi:nitrate reductase / nitrite oxidoreductase, beta subunit